MFGLIPFLFRQRILGFDVGDVPELDEGALEAFTHLLDGASNYLEYGIGGSTIMADHRGISTVSVEGDHYFAAAVRKKLESNCVDILTPDIGLTGAWSWPVFRKPNPRRIKKWRNYVEAPFKLEARRPDFVLIDGRLRRACAIEVARHCVGATMMIDDYSHRPFYHDIEEYLGKPRMAGMAAIFELQEAEIPPLDDYLTDLW